MARGSIFYWEARRRLGVLEQFRRNAERYLQFATWTPHGGWHEDDNARSLRQQLNEGVHDVRAACSFVGVATHVYYVPPPITGGVAGDIDLLENFFNLPRFQIPQQQLLDRLDRAIGVYRGWLRPLWWRLFNPFYWIGQLFARVAEAPFRILAAAGFDASRVEGSFWGKLTKAVVQFLAATAALLTVLEKLDLLGPAITAIKRELVEVRELASRDVPGPLVPELRGRVIKALRTLQRSGRAPGVVIVDRYNDDLPAVRYLLNHLTGILAEARIAYESGATGGVAGITPPPPPYVVQFASGAEDQAHALATALRPFIDSDPVLRESRGLRAGGVRITIVAQVDFRKNGSVILR